MKPNVYYEIPTDRYIFNKNEKPEEKIRQWVLFEILTTFGVNIKNIQVEVPVKVGTKTHFADIVIYENYKPIVVIECKRKEDNKPRNSLNQAISYASSKEINAVYAVSTNGIYWKCSKCIDPNDHKLSKYDKLYHARQILSRLTLGEIAHECSSSSTHNA